MNWSGLPDDVFQLARHLIKKCSSSRLNQNRPLYFDLSQRLEIGSITSSIADGGE